MELPALHNYKKELETELHSILEWWMSHSKNPHGSFFGEVNDRNEAIVDAPMGLVMYSRILWTFSAAYTQNKREPYREMAGRAYEGLMKYFKDNIHGGFYWSVDSKGNPLEKRKQLYGQAFAIYGLTEYAEAIGNKEILEEAISLFHLMREKGKDQVYGGYWEARSIDWTALEDSRLSEKDPNVAKSMNTNLHVLEAFTRLAKAWPDSNLVSELKELLTIFKEHIVNPETFSQRLYFASDWKQEGDIQSFGHDIEASWLLYEAACLPALQDQKDEFKELALNMAAFAATAIDDDGGLFYEHNLAQHHCVKEKHWWPQAEAMVGFFNAWELCKQQQYLSNSLKVWSFVKTKIKDLDSGEWYWGLNENGSIMKAPKAGFWKCPYHNGRACMELINRISTFGVL